MKETTLIDINVFVASPTDTSLERQKISSYIKDNWNVKIGSKMIVRLNVIMWEKHLASVSGIEVQKAIDEFLLEKCDLLIGIFWKKFGFSLIDGHSATTHEIEKFLGSAKPVVMYFFNKSIPPDEIDENEMAKIKEFKKKYSHRGIYKLIEPKKLLEALEQDLEFNVNRLVEEFKRSTGAISIISEKVDLADSEIPWQKISITREINQYMIKSGFPNLTYNNRLSFSENFDLWKLKEPANYQMPLIAERAREQAFEKKYGNYNYDDDLRSFYSDWTAPIHKILDDHKIKLVNKKILAVAANYGEEVIQIFREYLPHNTFEVLDFCNKAINRGRETYKELLNFYIGLMEKIDIPDSFQKYDLYLNLRSIHSNGVDRKETIRQSLKVLKPGGIAIFSISNGYLFKNELKTKPIKGMFDTIQGIMNVHIPYTMANDIRQIMQEYGYFEPDLLPSKSEIFVYGRKQE